MNHKVMRPGSLSVGCLHRHLQKLGFVLLSPTQLSLGGNLGLLTPKLAIMAKLISLAISFFFYTSKAKILTSTLFKAELDSLRVSEILQSRLMKSLSRAQENDLECMWPCRIITKGEKNLPEPTHSKSGNIFCMTWQTAGHCCRCSH